MRPLPCPAPSLLFPPLPLSLPPRPPSPPPPLPASPPPLAAQAARNSPNFSAFCGLDLFALRHVLAFSLLPRDVGETFLSKQGFVGGGGKLKNFFFFFFFALIPPSPVVVVFVSLPWEDDCVALFFSLSLSLSSFPLLWRLGFSPVNPLAAAAGARVAGLRPTRGVESGFSCRRWAGEVASARSPGPARSASAFSFCWLFI